MLKKSLNVVDVSSRRIVVNVVNNVEAQNRRFSAKISLRRLTAATFSPRRHSLYNVYMRCDAKSLRTLSLLNSNQWAQRFPGRPT